MTLDQPRENDSIYDDDDEVDPNPKVGVVWGEPGVDSDFIKYVEAILNCDCCQNNYTDSEHRHSEYCNATEK